jgi:UrcA family protein
MKTRIKASIGMITGTLLLGAACAATADELSNDPPSVKVSYADLDLGTTLGAETLYHRIAAAARVVCPDPAEHLPSNLSKAKTCRMTAIDHAVHEVSSARLAAVYASEGRRG